jgi:hypothetical protein
MPERTAMRLKVCRIGMTLALSAAALLGAANRAHAQGLFDALRGIFGGRAPSIQRILPPQLLEGFPGERESAQGEGGGPRVSYCVRLCDGRYFPVPATGRDQTSPDKLCRAMCPASQTRIFSGGGIDHAVANDGQPYSKLKNAFTYRDRLVPGCTCNGRDPTGLAAIDAESDPTLRPGDIVVTKDGPVVFKGQQRRGASTFVPATTDKQLPQQLRQSLAQMRIARTEERANVQSDTEPPRREQAAGSLLQQESLMLGFNPVN